MSERAGRHGAPGVGVDSRLAVSGHGRSGEQVPLCLYCQKESGQLSAGGCSAGAARFDMACAPAAGSAPAAGGHDGPVGDLKQVLDAQAAAGRTQLLCSLCFLRRMRVIRAGHWMTRTRSQVSGGTVVAR